MNINKTNKKNLYIETDFEEINKLNKEIADKGGSPLDQYDDPTCKHGDALSDCFICE